MTNKYLRVLFEGALDVAPDARSQWLDSHCDDRGDRLVLERLIAADAGEASSVVDGSFDTLFGALGEGAADSPPVGTQIGSFTLGEKLGEGGSSVVFVAQRELAGVVQRVALKLLRRNLYTQDEQRRFRDERRALGQLEHPGIARLIEGGVTESGTPYIALELVEGESILDHVRTHALDIPQRLRLFVAHRALIVHRDLKPSNVMVTSHGEVKLLDFGIAKLLDSEDIEHTQHRSMTPAYAAPEQFAGGQITTATDVYALGVVLAELVTGRRHESGDSRTPSAQVTDADACETGVASARALRALADDVARFLGGHPVQAHPPAAGYRARKFLLRHRGAALATVALVVVLLASLAAALWQGRAVQRQADIAAHEAQRAKAVRGFLEDLFEPVTEGVAERAMPTVKDLVGIGVGKVEADEDLAPAERVDLLTMFARLSANLGDDKRARELANTADTIAAAALPPTHPAAIDARVLLARQALEREDYAGAESILREALARVRAGGGADRASIEIMDQLGVIETKRDHREQALVLFRDALAELIRLDGRDAKSIADGYANVAAGLTNLGRFDEAAEAFQRAAEVDRVNRSPESYMVLSRLSNWGAALQVAGHIHAALEKFRAAEEGFAALGGKTRRMRAVNLQKLCVTEVSFAAPATAAATCARLLQVTREVAGESSTLMGLAVRTEASRLIEIGDFDGAALRLDAALQRLPDKPGNEENRAVIRYARASLNWLRGDTAAARDDARWAIDHISGLAILWGARLSARTVLLLTCIDGPHDDCSATPRRDLEVAIAEVRNTDDPRLLIPRVALARQDIESNPDAAASAISGALASARTELAASAAEPAPQRLIEGENKKLGQRPLPQGPLPARHPRCSGRIAPSLIS